MTTRHVPLLIVGAGAGGVSVASRMAKVMPPGSVALLDPAETHYYQPQWTLVGGGECELERTARPQSSVIPPGVEWIRERLTACRPEAREVDTDAGVTLTYDHLVLAAGLQIDWDAVPGLDGNVGRNGLVSNYAYQTVGATWPAIRDFEGGRAVFTHPNTPIKCGGAPQKIMYMAADHWRKHPRSRPTEIVFCIATPGIFGSAHYAPALVEVAERYGIDVRYRQHLTAVDAEQKVATIEDLESGTSEELPYDLMHVTPPMSAPDVFKGSSLGNEGGWIDVDAATLQHVRFPEVFALGDCSSLPTSKTAAAVRKQAIALAENLAAKLAGKSLSASYDGYTSCPLVTGYGKLVLAEFGYDGKPLETFPFDQRKERWSMYQLKKHFLPKLYWDGMLKGRL